MAEVDTAFVQMLRHYMWRVRTPPINPHRLAIELGISRTTVANWLTGTKPVPEIIPTLANKMGLPVEAVMRALDYPIVRDSALSDVFSDLAEWARMESGMDASQRDRFLTHLEELRHRYNINADVVDGLSKPEGDNHPKVKLAQ